MGCCVSKCRRNKNSLSHFNKHLQDKLVISHEPISNKILPSPPSPTSSISSFTCTTNISSFSSSNSSSLTSKDRSFSNKFLLSCYKENPHIITRIDSLTKYKTQPTKININPSPKNQNLPLKRVRSNSPTNLTRQKSFRKEVETQLRPNRFLGSHSPSPSRRFNATTISDSSSNVSKRMVTNSAKVSVANYSRCVNSSSIRKESVKAVNSSPNNSLRRIHSSGMNLKQSVVKDVISSHHHNMDSIVMEDIDNPLISLDCFIFL